MPAEPASNSPSAFDPQTWIDLLTVHAMKRDMFSAKTLMVIQEGVEQLSQALADPNCSIVITNFHRNLFDRLLRSFNNPSLLKEIGNAYLEEFRMPAVALKHFELARQFAPKDPDLERLQKAAALAMARQVTDQPSHSGISEPVPARHEVNAVMKKTVNLSAVIDARRHLDETAGALSRQQQDWRKSGTFKKKTMRLMVDVSKILERAQRLTAQTDFAGAFAALDEAQKQGAPKEELLAYYSKLGLVAFDHGRMQEALDSFLLTRDLSPDTLEAWFNCGLVYQKVGMASDALTCYQQAAKLAPDNPKIWCNLSSVWFELGNFEEAERCARASLELREDYVRAWDNLAAALSALNRLPEAAQACQQAIHYQPAYHAAWFKFGVINFQMDNYVVAREAFNMTGDNPDYFAYVLYYLSMIEARRGELDQAMQKLAEARHADPNNDLEITALKEIAVAFGKMGRYSTSADFYGQITVRRPEDYSAWLAFGTAHHRAEHPDKARQAYIRATELQPENPVPWHNLGLLASDQENHEESRRCFQQEVELAPNDAKAWYDLAVSLQALGRNEEAQDAYERAEGLVKSLARRSSDLSAALSIVRRLNLGERMLKTE